MKITPPTPPPPPPHPPKKSGQKELRYVKFCKGH